jgi:peroxiredoxin
MPGGGGSPQQQISNNEKRLLKEGIVALEAGQAAPAFSARGTAGAQLSVSTSKAEAVPASSLGAALAGAAADPAAEAALEAPAEPASPADAADDTAVAPDSAAPAAQSVPAEPAATTPAADSEGGLTVLLFFPAPNTPNSAKQLVQFSKKQALWDEHNVHVYAISSAPLEQLEAFARDYAISIPILSDPGGAISAAYGCMAPGGKYPQRTAVGLDSSSKVVFFQRGQVMPPLVLEKFGLGAKPESSPPT